MTTYSNPRMNQLSNYAITIAARNGNTCITYHSTVIVEFDADCIILRTGGWKTVTTKRKMNQAANQFGLGYRVFQQDGNWFVRRPDGGDMPFDRAELMIDRRTGAAWQAEA